MQNNQKIKIITAKQVVQLLQTKNPANTAQKTSSINCASTCNLALTRLKNGNGLLLNRRQFMRTNHIGTVSAIPAFVRKKQSALNLKLAVKNIGYSTLIYAK